MRVRYFSLKWKKPEKDEIHFGTPKAPKIGIIRDKKGQKLIKLNVSHQYGKKNVS